MPLVSAEEGLTEQVQAAVRVAGPVWVAGADVPHCRALFPAEDGDFGFYLGRHDGDYFVALQAIFPPGLIGCERFQTHDPGGW